MRRLVRVHIRGEVRPKPALKSLVRRAQSGDDGLWVEVPISRPEFQVLTENAGGRGCNAKPIRERSRAGGEHSAKS